MGILPPTFSPFIVCPSLMLLPLLTLPLLSILSFPPSSHAFPSDISFFYPKNMGRDSTTPLSILVDFPSPTGFYEQGEALKTLGKRKFPEWTPFAGCIETRSQIM